MKILFILLSAFILFGCGDDGNSVKKDDLCDRCDPYYQQCNEAGNGCDLKDGFCISDIDCSDQTDGKIDCDIDQKICIEPEIDPCDQCDLTYQQCNEAGDGCELKPGYCLTDLDCSDNLEGKTVCNVDQKICIEPQSQGGEGELCYDSEPKCDDGLICNNQNICEVEQIEPILYHIVVIGSSTAEGIGPDYCWVDRFRDHLQWINSGHRVTNLAKGGYNSYRYLPDGTVPENGQMVDSERNITKAISLDPDFIVLNNPSNDIWLDDYNIDTLFQNYDTIIAEADRVNIPIYITTSQPTLYDQSQRDRLIAIKDRAVVTFGDYLLDFWTGIADEDGSTLEPYQTDDDVHLNDAAHHILANRVLEKLPLELEEGETEKIIHYKTGWDTPYIHYLKDDNSWNSVPGDPLASEGEFWFTITIEDQGRVEFVFNDGASDWDNNGNENYKTTLKEFWIKNGIIYDHNPE